MSLRIVALSISALVALGCGGDDDGGGRPDGSVVCSSDGECDDGTFCNGAERCDPDDSASDLLGCVSPGSPCIEGRSCDEADAVCTTDCGSTEDADGDGHEALECGGADCDDGDDDNFPGNVEVCDVEGHDEDCDPTTYGFRDADGDGAPDARCCNTLADGTSSCGDDCDDMRPAISPVAAETCDMLDNDCDGSVDEGTAPDAWYADGDGDGHGDPLDSMLSCGAIEGRVPRAGDCDDTDAAINPDAAEACDGIDNDCDGALNAPGEDDDGDGVASATCGGSDCDDASATVFPGATELCNRVDDDCSSGGGVDAAEDADDDGFASLTASCEGGPLPKLDCDDSDAMVFFGAPELCNRIDDDCSSGGGVDTTEDADSDGHAPTTAPCMGGALPRDDCDDASAARFAGNGELCDGLDNDCDAMTVVDVGCAASIDVGPGSSTALAGTLSGTYFCEDPSFSPCGPGCPAGSALVGLQLRESGIVRQVTGLCRAMNVTLRPGREDVYDVTWGTATTITSHGTATGMGGTTQCARDEWVTGIHGRAAASVDRLGVVCGTVEIRGSRSSGYTTRTTFVRDALARGGIGGSPFRRTCAADRLIGGYEGFTASAINGIAPFCGRSTVNVR